MFVLFLINIAVTGADAADAGTVASGRGSDGATVSSAPSAVAAVCTETAEVNFATLQERYRCVPSRTIIRALAQSLEVNFSSHIRGLEGVFYHRITRDNLGNLLESLVFDAFNLEIGDCISTACSAALAVADLIASDPSHPPSSSGRVSDEAGNESKRLLAQLAMLTSVRHIPKFRQIIEILASAFNLSLPELSQEVFRCFPNAFYKARVIANMGKFLMVKMGYECANPFSDKAFQERTLRFVQDSGILVLPLYRELKFTSTDLTTMRPRESENCFVRIDRNTLCRIGKINFDLRPEHYSMAFQAQTDARFPIRGDALCIVLQFFVAKELLSSCWLADPVTLMFCDKPKTEERVAESADGRVARPRRGAAESGGGEPVEPKEDLFKYLAKTTECPIATGDGRGIINEMSVRHVVCTNVATLLTKNIWFPSSKGVAFGDERYECIDVTAILHAVKRSLE